MDTHDILKASRVRFMLKNIKLLIPFFILVGLSSCIIVKVRTPDEEFDIEFTILKKPSVPMSDVLIRSERGDMIAFLPKDWFFIDPEDKIPSNIFSVSANPDYSLCLIFAKLTNRIDVPQVLKKEGLLGIAKRSFEQKQSKSLNNVKLLGDFVPIKNGLQRFYIYKYENVANNLIGKTAVFVTPLNEAYEFSLIETNINKRENISNTEFDEIFNSVLASIQF